ncbi:hypothetical protein CHLNCDRAFT_136987 [Chlorella variabilis]|uniref:ABC transporter domain-containing protein n=1 Tax=Chlorella variabilis TaxID=554065 RepID=E1ZLR3_CHLVA|nr:hypothetical protein CHLNCDRAFT_136987 [Chlorella variabilis]EFN53179.1 hypothetical protein CHLNCDRAFT_136987 [Chlorella variabilis]|eukprot:XP_005845281.1 hypothetical protein CHLNCDRAFT_136987 [Chlorella variabilis]
MTARSSRRPASSLAAAAAAALLLLAAGASCVAAQAPAGCTLTLYLNASASSLSMAGSSVVQPIQQPLIPKFPDALVGFEGALSLVLPGGPCPTTAAGVEQRLAGASLQTTAATPPLLLYPAESIELQGSTFVTLDLRGNEFNVSSAPLAAAPGGGAGAYSTTLEGVIVKGSVLSTSLITTELLPMAGNTASNASSVTAAAQGNTLTVTATVDWAVRSTYNTTFGTNVIEGISEYIFRGLIVAEATLGCPADCGPNGRCAQADDGALGCACQCGWSGANCTVPSGFCSSFPAELTGQAVCPVAPPASPAPAPDTPCQPSKECTAQQAYNSSTGRCDCKAGWDGPSCDACQSDDACDALFETSGASCSEEVAFQQGMQVKAFTCDLEASPGSAAGFALGLDRGGTGLEQTIVPGSFYMVCNTSALPNGEAPASTADQFCQVHFALSGKADNPITCTATECGFKANSSRTDCATTTCACETECPDVEGILNRIKGQPCSIDCTPEGLCTFDIQDFFVTLVAPCQTAACVVPGYTFVQGEYTITQSQSYDGVIAAIPLMVLAGLAGFLGFYLLRHHALFRSGAKAAAAAAAGGAAGEAAAVRRRPAEPVQLLTFDSLSCTVPVRQGRPWYSAAGRLLCCGRRKPAPAPAAAEGAAGATADVAADVAASWDPPGRKQILKGVSGVAACGELVGVMGPSGSGKTTLLAMLAGSSEDLDRRSTLGGAVLLDGHPMHSAARRKIAYVAQDDTLLPTLTVEELHDATSSQVQAAVRSVLSELGLSHVARTRVGGSSGIRGVSGGERRRVTIAMELVTEPAVLVLDEPTSGLDSFTAINLMRTLKQVAGDGRIVLLSYHQPSPAMFTLLDRAYLMAQGHCLFSGPPSAAEGWFASMGLPCPVDTAIAEHMLDAVSTPASLQQLLAARGKGQAPDDDSAAAAAADGLLPVPLAGRYADNGGLGGSGSTAKLGSGSEDGGETGEAGGASPAPSVAASSSRGAAEQGQPRRPRRQRRSLSRELAVVFWRTLVDILRNPSLLLLHWMLALLMGVFVGAVFFDVTFDVSGAQNRVGGMFFVLSFFAFTSLTTVDLFMMERKMVMREVRGGYYSPATYLLAKMVLDALLLRVIPVFIFSAPFYPMMGLQTGSATIATFLMVLASFAGAVGALSLAVTVGSSTAGVASLVMNIVLLLSVVVSGMLVNPESMPAWIGWTHWLSIFFYAYSALMINEMTGIKIDFALEGYAAASNVRGTVFLETIGINASDLTRDIVILDCFYLALALLAFLNLYRVMPRAKRFRRPAPSSHAGSHAGKQREASAMELAAAG